MKIALVHDYLCGIGGAERVFQYMCEEFKEADVFTLSYNSKHAPEFFKKLKIRTTWLNIFVQSMDAFRFSFPISTYVMESLDLSDYDIVLSSSASVAKYINVPNGIHICYCYTPTRAIWQTDLYFGTSPIKFVLQLIRTYLKKRDFNAAQRVTYFIAISKFSQNQILSYYKRHSDILNSPIEIDRFVQTNEKSNHFLLVSRLESWKRVDFAIEAFNILGLPLKIIGTGRDEKRLRSIAASNIEFLGSVNDSILVKEYSAARAVIFTPFLEYGLIPLEANACGTPVICYGFGGVVETMIPYDSELDNSQDSTAVFFFEQTAISLVEAVTKFEKLHFDSDFLVCHAKRWNVDEFRRQLRNIVSSKTKN